MNTDARRRQYVPISVDLPWTRTGHNLMERFGPEGLLVWVLVLCAAKRGFTQGEFSYVTEPEAWAKLGLEEQPFDFTLEEFFEYTGRIHATRTTGKRAKNGVKVREIRAWNEWNSDVRRQQDAEKKSRKRARFTGDDTATMRGTEVELEYEYEAIEGTRIEDAPLSQEQKAENAAAAKRLLEQLNGKHEPAPAESDIPF